MGRLAAFELHAYPRRVLLMAGAALAALAVDFASKHVAVAVEPDTLLFNVSSRSPFGLGSALIAVVLACSLLACVFPLRVVAIGAGAALGGALGNLVSRRWWDERGGSPDFIRFSDGSVGNLADVFIFTGGCAMVLGALLWVALVAAGRVGGRRPRPGP